MDRRRKMARRLGVLLLVVVMAALVGVREGNGAQGKDDVEVKIGSGKTFGEKVLPWATIGWAVVTGGIMIWLGWQQKKMLKRQTEWEEKFGERELEQERELAERQEWWGRLEVRREALRRAMEYLRSAWRQGTLSIEDQVGFEIESWAIAGVFGKEEGKIILEFGKKAKKGKEVVEGLWEEGRRAGGARPEELKRLEERQKEVLAWVGAAFMKLARACWERKPG